MILSPLASTVADSPGYHHRFASRKPFSTLLKEARALTGPRSKTAAQIGGDQENEFEQAFATLAYTYVKDKAPRLLDFMVGFQLVDRNDDNTKAIGVFGFKVGKQWVYAPVFFLNGDLKGHELLYLKSQDMFVPMKENWVNYVLAKKPHVLGEAKNKSLSQLGITQPDIRSMSIPPYNSKYGGAREAVAMKISGWRPETVEFAPIYGALTTDRGEYAFKKFGSFQSEQVLEQFLRENVGFCKIAVDACRIYPAIGQMMEKFHPGLLKEALLDLRKRTLTPVTKQASSVLGHNRESRLVARATSVLGTPKPIKFAAGDPVEIRMKNQVGITDNLSDHEEEQLSRDGYLVKDMRAGDEITKRYNTQQLVEMSNPDASGLYEILQKPGEFVKCVVFMHPHSNNRQMDAATAIRLDPKDWINAHPTTLFAKPNISTKEDFNKWYDGLSKSKPEKGGVYVVVTQDGQGSVPFKVTESLEDGRYSARFFDRVERRRPLYLPSTDSDALGRNHCFSSESWGPSLLQFNEREGTKFKSMQNTLFVPAEYKLLEIKKPSTSDSDFEDSFFDIETHSSDTSFLPGDDADIQLQITQKTAQLKLYCDGNDVSINGGPLMSKLAAVITLIKQHGFADVAARNMLKEAEVLRLRGKFFTTRVKYADAYSETMGQGPSAPAFPAEQQGFDPSYGNVPMSYPQVDQQSIPELSGSQTDPNTYNPLPEATPDPMAMQAAQQAGQQGQKEIFDTAMISGLLKTVRQDSLVNKYMGDLLKALDRLGRILFMFYWHNEEFINRYGKSDAPELEDSLRNSFESLGDLCLFLKEKDVEPLVKGQQGEPDIQESALN